MSELMIFSDSKSSEKGSVYSFLALCNHIFIKNCEYNKFLPEKSKVFKNQRNPN